MSSTSEGLCIINKESLISVEEIGMGLIEFRFVPNNKTDSAVDEVKDGIVRKLSDGSYLIKFLDD